LTEAVYAGGCFCGDIRFEVSGPLLYSAFCHCESCRRASGGAYVAWATFAAAGFDILAGELTRHHSSPGVTRGHCAKCGTSLTYEHAGREGQIDVTVAAFDDPSQFEPVAHIFVEDKLDCVRLDDGLPRYSRNTGSPEI
jgi:hypothetical protein